MRGILKKFRSSNKLSDRTMLTRRRRLALNAIATAIVSGVAVVSLIWIARFAQTAIGVPREAYASDWTAVFIIEHLRTSETWPTGWLDLQDEFDQLAVPSHYAWTFNKLQTLIDVDWDASVSEIRDSETPPQHVRLTSGRSVSFNGDPNALIYDYITTGNDPNRIRERIGRLAEKPTTGD